MTVIRAKFKDVLERLASQPAALERCGAQGLDYVVPRTALRREGMGVKTASSFYDVMPTNLTRANTAPPSNGFMFPQSNFWRPSNINPTLCRDRWRFRWLAVRRLVLVVPLLLAVACAAEGIVTVHLIWHPRPADWIDHSPQATAVISGWLLSVMSSQRSALSERGN